VLEELCATGVRAVAFKSDQADTSGARALFDDVVGYFGGLDILVNNAAISPEQGIARDLGRRGITANVVEVGSLSLQRMGHPDEIAAAIGFLASPAASYVTGAVVDAHGGDNA
jgi:NAD(P)-dependent dehydrogenase (short-subunit alcohol dehydrogenase family)